MRNFNGSINSFRESIVYMKGFIIHKKALIDNVYGKLMMVFSTFLARPDCTFDIPNYFESMEVAGIERYLGSNPPAQPGCGFLVTQRQMT